MGNCGMVNRIPKPVEKKIWSRLMLSKLVSGVTPLALAFILVRELWAVIEKPYGGYPQWMLVVFGWLAAALVAVAGFAIARVPWRPETSLDVGDRPENDTTARSQP